MDKAQLKTSKKSESTRDSAELNLDLTKYQDYFLKISQGNKTLNDIYKKFHSSAELINKRQGR